MVNIHCAYTEPINPSGASPILSRDQVWRGLQRKIRKAQDFVPVIEGTDVLEEKENEVTRVAHFKGAEGKPGHQVKEICKSYYPTKVDFWQPSGALITNTVSDGPGLTEHDYNMTYTFEWRYPDVQEGSDEHKRLQKQHVDMAKMAVHSSIEALRRMASAGELD
ncbi:hypothetical protein D0867_05426 [Hortaea werneckii]|uniref:DUF1857-domain-containing protein n=1 Tax=Hortaea werneckii TaxID=91943 RepID=A0A3M6ZSY1_HORWE|nr:hypothetical protein D0867_05426 [Hortaea werneckii]RMY33989.1 hypothetical protein D0866_05555 [Hortaea werneckii]